jgi:tRNA pseudouridine55 synthase
MTAGSKSNRRSVNGILLLDKPSGGTSNHALQRAKRMFNARKAGHTGSLDPLASGMLPLCFGEATKVSGFLLDSDKSYRVTARLGQKTDSADADGKVIETAPVPELSEARVRAVLESFLGEGEQIPPMYSALKVNGRRLYELARKGEQIERAARRIVIHEISLVSLEDERMTCDVRCSKGTYIRSLVEDVAEKLGTLAHVEVLRRTGVGGFGGATMLTFEELEAMEESGNLDDALLPVDSALEDWPRVSLDEAGVERLFQGQKVPSPDPEIRGKLRVYGPEGNFLGLADAEIDGNLVPQRLFPGLRTNTGQFEAK